MFFQLDSSNPKKQYFHGRSLLNYKQFCVDFRRLLLLLLSKGLAPLAKLLCSFLQTTAVITDLLLLLQSNLLPHFSQCTISTIPPSRIHINYSADNSSLNYVDFILPGCLARHITPQAGACKR